jgi:protein ImuA
MLQALRARIAAIEGFSPAHEAGTCPTSWAALDAALPGGGLREGALHEIHSPDPADGAALGFVVRLTARLLAAHPSRPGLLASCRADLFAPGLHAAGLDPGRLLMARCRDSDELLFACEEGLKSNALAAILGEIGELDFSLSRRLQLATAETGATLFLLRPARFADEASAAVTRWRAESRPGGGWSLTLFRCRGGRPGHWQMPAETVDVDKCRQK